MSSIPYTKFAVVAVSQKGYDFDAPFTLPMLTTLFAVVMMFAIP